MEHENSQSRRIDNLAFWLETVVAWVETAVAVILTVVIVLAVAFVAFETFTVVSGGLPQGDGGIFKIIKAVLDTFLVIELFRITIAYVRHREVIPTVLETALVVAAREIVVIEAGAKHPLAAAAVGGTLVAIGVTWYLLRRSGACGCEDHATGA